MGCFFSKSKRDPKDRIVYQNNKIYLPYDGPVQRCAEFTPEYAESCRQFYTNLIWDGQHIMNCNMKKDMYVEIPCMLPPIHRTYYNEPKEEITNPFNTNNYLEDAFIRSHKDLNGRTYDKYPYVAFRPVFKIIESILHEMNRPYIMHFQRIGFNYNGPWKEDNAVLRILFVQNSHTGTAFKIGVSR
jgi:hypothetical protein